MNINDIISKRVESEALNEEINEGGGSRARKKGRKIATVAEKVDREMKAKGYKNTSPYGYDVDNDGDFDYIKTEYSKKGRPTAEIVAPYHVSLKGGSRGGDSYSVYNKKRHDWDEHDFRGSKPRSAVSKKLDASLGRKNEEALDYLLSTYDIDEETANDIIYNITEGKANFKDGSWNHQPKGFDYQDPDNRTAGSNGPHYRTNKNGDMQAAGQKGSNWENVKLTGSKKDFKDIDSRYPGKKKQQ